MLVPQKEGAAARADNWLAVRAQESKVPGELEFSGMWCTGDHGWERHRASFGVMVL